MFEINNLVGENLSELEEVDKFLKFALKKLSLGDVVFGVIITDNKMIRELNRNYRNIDRETDVISFALEDDHTFDSGDVRVLGDIYISIDKAREQAFEYGHSLLREMAFLSIHGLLHLLGYDHMKKSDEEVMFKLQEEVLVEYGIKE